MLVVSVVVGAVGTLAAPQGGGDTVWAGVYTAEQATRGEASYRESCGSCHGTTLQGGEAPALAGAAFAENWNGLTAGDLFERIRTSMPPDQPGKLERQQTADVVAFVFKSNGWPTGQTELPLASLTLKQIRISAQKP